MLSLWELFTEILLRQGVYMPTYLRTVHSVRYMFLVLIGEFRVMPRPKAAL